MVTPSNVREEAPLGLDFEMPETVWIVEHASDPSLVLLARQEPTMVAAWMSAGDVCDCARRIKLYANALSEGRLVPKTPDQLLSEIDESEGFVLMDADGAEIARRYCR